jgi:hypothetical protein
LIIIQLQSKVQSEDEKRDNIFFFISPQNNGIFKMYLSKYIFVLELLLNKINKIIVIIIHIIIFIKFFCKKLEQFITRVVSFGKLTFAH